jgi:hypothetical protein
MADNSDDAFDIGEVQAAPEIPDEWQGGAVYTLELPVRCPHCRDSIRTIRVLRLSRTQVSFTSTLPRQGRAFACPQCEKLLSVELSGLI